MTVVNYKPSYNSAMSNQDFPQKQAINNAITRTLLNTIINATRSKIIKISL